VKLVFVQNYTHRISTVAANMMTRTNHWIKQRYLTRHERGTCRMTTVTATYKAWERHV